MTPWTVAVQVSSLMEFSREEYWKYSLLQRIFPTQGRHPGLLHCRQILCHLSHRGMCVDKVQLWGQGGRVKQYSSLSTGISAWLRWHIDTGGLKDSTCHLFSSLFQGFSNYWPCWPVKGQGPWQDALLQILRLLHHFPLCRSVWPVRFTAWAPWSSSHLGKTNL